MCRLPKSNIIFSYNYILKVYSYFNIFWAIFGIFVMPNQESNWKRTAVADIKKRRINYLL